ncbi:hypothetical protein EU546_06585 [Candidatus Thorarchaeota archaeon]|nr:MAG: hypothetical protein EU546_06585 [Candidatus Thorarchaeota archaeon]
MHKAPPQTKSLKRCGILTVWVALWLAVVLWFLWLSWTRLDLLVAFFTLLPTSFCALGLCIAKGEWGMEVEKPHASVFQMDSWVYTGDYASDVDESPAIETSYSVPAECTSCGERIDNQSVIWIGPMLAECPHCGSDVRARARPL